MVKKLLVLLKKTKKFFLNIFFHLFKKKLQKGFWIDLEEMPVFNWFKIHETNNLTYLRKKPRSGFEYNARLEQIWFKLYDDFLERFGVPDDLKNLLRLKKQRIDHLLNYVINDNKFALTEAEFVEKEIDQMFHGTEKVDDYETIILIESNLGFKMDVKNTSVVEYYNYLNFINKQAKRNGKD